MLTLQAVAQHPRWREAPGEEARAGPGGQGARSPRQQAHPALKPAPRRALRRQWQRQGQTRGQATEKGNAPLKILLSIKWLIYIWQYDEHEIHKNFSCYEVAMFIIRAI